MWQNKTLKRGLLWLAIALGALLLLVTINQLISLYRNLSMISPWLALVVTILVGLIFSAILWIPLMGFYRFPRMEQLPDSTEDPDYPGYIERQLQRLRANRYLKSIDYGFEGEDDEERVHRAFRVLEARGQELMKTDATAVFLTTAVSQNGILDGFTVLAALMKLVYNLTILYENRPELRRIMYLYGQIAGVVLLVRSIEDADLIEDQVEPLIAALLGGTIVSAVPGAVGITTLVVNSVVEGAVNSLLTLRVGAIAQRYLSASVQFDKRLVRRSASLEATKMLSSILADNAVLVVKSFAKATRDATKNALKLPWRRA